MPKKYKTMGNPKTTYSFRLSPGTIKKMDYIEKRLRKKASEPLNRTQVIESSINQLFDQYRTNLELFKPE